MFGAARFCRSKDGARLAWATAGRGPAIVRAPHWFTHLEHEASFAPWTDLARDHALVCFDQRGCGLSDRNADISFEAWVDDLASVVDAAGHGRFALLALSQGVSIAIAYAARHPERVSHLILYGGYARGWAKRGLAPAALAQARTLAQLIEVGWEGGDASFRQVFSSQFMPDADLAVMSAFNEMMRLSASAATAAAIYRTLGDIDVEEEAASLSCPALVLHGRGDMRAPFEEGRRLAGLIPGARFIPLDTRNHIIQPAEAAWQRCLEEIRAFYPPSGGSAPGGFSGLTPRQREVLDLLARGLDNAQIAARLTLSEKTVRNNITQIFDRLQVENRGQAIVRAREAGFGAVD